MDEEGPSYHLLFATLHQFLCAVHAVRDRIENAAAKLLHLLLAAGSNDF